MDPPVQRQLPLAASRLGLFVRLYLNREELMVPGGECIAISGMSPETLAARPPRNMTGDPNETVGSNLATFVFHECYHVGQTGVLRRVVGKPGAVKLPGGW